MARAQGGLTPIVPIYRIRPGDRLEVEVVQPDGGRALVIGKPDAVPEGAGGLALRIRVCDAARAGGDRRVTAVERAKLL